MISNWNDKATCGQVEDKCTPKGRINSGVVLVEDENGCEKALADECHPGLLYRSSNGIDSIRSGSSKCPITLPHLQKKRDQCVTNLVASNAAGDLFSWSPVKDCERRRLVVNPDDSSICLIPDINSEIFKNTCEESMSNVTHVAGAVKSINCHGETEFHVKFFPISELISAS